MPNGGSWDRFWFTVGGFRARFGLWPTRVRLYDQVINTVAAHLSADELAALASKVELIVGEEFAAEDEQGHVFPYDGPGGKLSLDGVDEWLGFSRHEWPFRRCD